MLAEPARNAEAIVYIRKLYEVETIFETEGTSRNYSHAISYIYKHLIINKKALCLIAEGCTSGIDN